MDAEKTRLLNLMRFWLFGTFVIVFAAITAYIGIYTDRDWMLAIRAGLPIWGLTAVLCLAAYFGYRYYLIRK
jgi:hypothetical protein